MKSLEELKAIREKMQGQIGIRNESSDMTRVVIGMATCGIAAGARPFLTAFSDAYRQRTSCTGSRPLYRPCQYEPIVEVLSR